MSKLKFKEDCDRAAEKYFQSIKGLVIDSHNDAQAAFIAGVEWALSASPLVLDLIKHSRIITNLVETEFQGITVPGIKKALNDYDEATK